ncbi:hypothetical protein HK097_001451 [Rhizophlyctis rosea]|uniref:Uncharacterized protein n=1 Tax=Rhizophlyctis rosea TaxID=64517 RepID=A0AAD5SN73_9FUNG|nr:hypothetical protein HK097_001451 [Rhizophlyctis rosea]
MAELTKDSKGACTEEVPRSTTILDTAGASTPTTAANPLSRQVNSPPTETISPPQWTKYKSLVAFAQLGAMLLGLLPYLIGSNLPVHTFYESGRKTEAGLLFLLAQAIYNLFGYSLASPQWIRTCLGLPFSLLDWRSYLPAIALTLWCTIVYLTPIFTGHWPFPFLPIFGGGVGFNIWPPLVTYWMLPRDMRKETGFLWKFVLSATVPFALDMFWFVLILYYTAIVMVQEVYRIVVIICFKIATLAFMGMMIHPIRLGGAAKFAVECCYEIYIFFTLSLVESWATFLIYLSVEMSCLTIELCHHHESTLAAILSLPLSLLSVCRRMRKAEIAVVVVEKEKEKTGREVKGVREEEEGAMERKGPEGLPKSVWELHEESVKKSGKVRSERKDLSLELYERLVHYILGIHARIFAAIAVSLFLPTWYYGPNRNAYIFDFPSFEVPTSILKSWLSVLAALLHFTITAVYVRRVYLIDLAAPHYASLHVPFTMQSISHRIPDFLFPSIEDTLCDALTFATMFRLVATDLTIWRSLYIGNERWGGYLYYDKYDIGGKILKQSRGLVKFSTILGIRTITGRWEKGACFGVYGSGAQSWMARKERAQMILPYDLQYHGNSDRGSEDEGSKGEQTGSKDGSEGSGDKAADFSLEVGEGMWNKDVETLDRKKSQRQFRDWLRG